MRLVRILLPLVTGNVFQLIGLVPEKLVYLLLILDDSLRDNLSVLDHGAVLGSSSGVA